MYLAERDQIRAGGPYVRALAIDRNVVLLGLTSLFTDVS
jgi:hypothetical protein